MEVEEQLSQMESTGDAQNFFNQKPKGGWISSLLILGTSLGINVASGAWYANLIVFLIKKFNVKNIHAAQINNIFSGLINFCPLIAAIITDSSLGAFSVVLISCIVSLVGVVMFTLIVSVHSLRPPPCTNKCEPPSTFQYSFLYIALSLGSIGLGGTRFLFGPMGADQLEKPKHQASFFNWFVFTLYFSGVISYTILIYLQDNVSWVLSYAIALVANAFAIVLFLFGSRLYRKVPPQGSPFASIARVLVAALRKIGVKQPVDEEYCYFYESEESKLSYGPPSKSLRLLNRASLIKRGPKEEKPATKTKSWTLCTVEEVEDLKKLIKLLPLWSTSILVSTPISVSISLAVLMALVMDTKIGPSQFQIPPGTFVVVTLLFTSITTPILDCFIYPTYKKIRGRNLTLLQKLGVGHFCNIVSMVSFALVEQKRLKLVHEFGNQVQLMSALWLILPLAIMGIGEGFYLPAEVALFYQEFPNKLRTTSTAMVSLHVAAGYYVSSGFIDLVGRLSSWLPNDINHGRVDYVFWVLLVMAALNFGYFLLCATFYKYKNLDQELDGEMLIVPS